MYSYWENENFFSKQNIIIIGSGFVGLGSAIELAQKNKKLKITILERGIIPTGASTKNAGFSCFGSPTELINDSEEFSEKTMWNTVEKRYKGIEKINKIFTNIDIDYDANGGFECLNDEDTLLVEKKLDWLNNGMKNITGKNNLFEFCNHKKQIFGLHQIHSLISNNLERGLNPAKLIIALQQKAIGLGIKILNTITVKEIINNANEVKIITENNINFITDRLLICTNGFTQKLLPNIEITPQRGQVLITKPINNLKLKGYFHYESGFYYFRNVGDKILIGGARNTDFENENTSEFDTTEKIKNTLIEFIKNHILPNTPFEIETAWSGIMGFNKNKQAVVKQIENNIYCAVGMNGIGVALAPIIAEDVVTMMQ